MVQLNEPQCTKNGFGLKCMARNQFYTQLYPQLHYWDTAFITLRIQVLSFRQRNLEPQIPKQFPNKEKLSSDHSLRQSAVDSFSAAGAEQGAKNWWGRFVQVLSSSDLVRPNHIILPIALSKFWEGGRCPSPIPICRPSAGVSPPCIINSQISRIYQGQCNFRLIWGFICTIAQGPLPTMIPFNIYSWHPVFKRKSAFFSDSICKVSNENKSLNTKGSRM